MLERALQPAGGHAGPAFCREGLGARGSVLVTIRSQSHRKGPGRGERSRERAQVPRGSHSGRGKRNLGSKGAVQEEGKQAGGGALFLEAGPASSCSMFPQPHRVLHTAAKGIKGMSYVRDRT